MINLSIATGARIAPHNIYMVFQGTLVLAGTVGDDLRGTSGGSCPTFNVARALYFGAFTHLCRRESA
jgi:hypothetical protein